MSPRPSSLSKDIHVLLVAMSGVRVYDPELAKLGLTLPGFIDRGQTIAALPSLGLLTLAAHSPPDVHLSYAEIDTLGPEHAEQIINQNYDIVAISSLSARIADAYKLADALRAAGIFVVMGGLHVSALPEEAALHANSIVVGEGEFLWADFLMDFKEGKPQSIYSQNHRIGKAFSFSYAKVPRYDLLPPGQYNRIPLQTTRGCPLACTFCGSSRTISPFKRKAHALIRHEIETILNLWPEPFIELADDNTFVDKSWSKELMHVFKPYKIPWFTETDLSAAFDEYLLDCIADAGCAGLLIGFESMERLQLKHAEPKGVKAALLPHSAEKIAAIQSRGIPVTGCFVFGFDEDDPAIFERSLPYIDSLGLCDVQITLLTPFAGTPLFQSLSAQNRLFSPIDWSRFTLFDTTFSPAKMSADELSSGFRRLMEQLYSPERTQERKQRFQRITKARLKASKDAGLKETPQ